MPLDQSHAHSSASIMRADDVHNPINPSGGSPTAAQVSFNNDEAHLPGDPVDVQGAIEAGVALPVDLGPGLFTVDEDGVVSIRPSAITEQVPGEVPAALVIQGFDGQGQNADLLYVRNFDSTAFYRVNYDGSMQVSAPAAANLLVVAGADGTVFVVRGDNGEAVAIAADEPDGTVLAMRGATGQTGPLIDGTTDTGEFTVLPNSAIRFDATVVADADLYAGSVALYFDKTNGAAKLMVKGKTADGTVVEGEIALS